MSSPTASVTPKSSGQILLRVSPEEEEIVREYLAVRNQEPGVPETTTVQDYLRPAWHRLVRLAMHWKAQQLRA